jgi:hypothetical protein
MVITNPTHVDEDEIFLPNTTRYLEDLRIKHAQNRCVLGVPGGGGGGEYDPLPVSPNKVARSNFTLSDDVEVIRGPREKARTMNAMRRDDDEVSFDVKVSASGIPRRNQEDSSLVLVSKRKDDSESILRWQQDPLLRRNKYGFRESGESAAADSILNKIKLRRQERENERRLRELAEIDPESSSEDDFSAVGGDEDDEARSQVIAVDRDISDLSFASVRDKEEASTKRRKAINKRLPCGLMSLLLDDDEMKEMQEMGRYTSPRSPCGFDTTDDPDEMQEIGRFVGPKTTFTSPSGDGNNDDVDKKQEIGRFAWLKATVTSPSGCGSHDGVALPKTTVASPSGAGNNNVDEKQEIGRFAWLKATVTSRCGANNDDHLASYGTANDDGTKNKNESTCISAFQQQDEARDDFSPGRLLCGAGDDVSTSDGHDEVLRKGTDSSGRQWIDTVKKVVKKETKPAMPWLDTVSSSDSIVEEKKEGSKVASAMNTGCTNFASMLLIEEEENIIVEEKKEGSKVASAMNTGCTNFASMLLIEEEENSIVEEKKEGSKVASAMNTGCTNFASMLLIEEEEITELKKYSCW